MRHADERQYPVRFRQARQAPKQKPDSPSVKTKVNLIIKFLTQGLINLVHHLGNRPLLRTALSIPPFAPLLEGRSSEHGKRQVSGNQKGDMLTIGEGRLQGTDLHRINGTDRIRGNKRRGTGRSQVGDVLLLLTTKN